MSQDSYKYKSVKLKELAKKIRLFENKKLNLENAQNFYFPTFTDSIGLFEIFKLFKIKINYFDFYLKIFKNTFSGIFFSYSKIYKNNKTTNYENIIFTWANFKNFDRNGSLNDRYFNLNSRQTKNTLWVVVYIDNKIPKLIDQNILIYQNIRKSTNIVKFFFLF